MSLPSVPPGVAIGVDIGGTNVRAARIDPGGGMAAHVKVRTDSRPTVAELVGDLVHQLMSDDVVAVGIGIPGRLDRDGTTILSAGFVDLADLRLGERIAAGIGRPVILDNDAHMALVAELQLGAATDADHVVMFTVGTGIGGAVAASRVVLRGRGNAGQLGHLTLDPAGPACRCGRQGCSEVFTSGTALTGYMREVGLPVGTTAEQLIDRHDQDPVAAAVLQRWATAWRLAIDTAVAALDPDLVILGGGLGGAARMALRLYSPETSPWFQCPVMAARLGDDAGVIGAGLRAFAA
jgi:glucokinase